MRKIIIAIDSFKGSLTSQEAGDTVAETLKEIFPYIQALVFPVSDGGEGLLSALVSFYQGQYINLYAHNPLMEKIKTRYGVSSNGKTAFIEMAAVSGLPLIPAERYNPLLTTTYGTGELIRDALDKGIRNFIVGLGGSATNDAGLGMLQALGYRFLDKNGKVLGTGGQIMEKVSVIDGSCQHPALSGCNFVVAFDVNSSFCGPNGAACIFARQKGANNEMIKKLDAGMHSLKEVILKYTGMDLNSIPGAGAAGGMGAAFAAFLNARMIPGIDLLLDIYNFSDVIEDADLIITGEGKADRQTLMGKVPSGILRVAKQKYIPVVLLAGRMEDSYELEKAGFHALYPITPEVMPLEEALRPEIAKTNIKKTLQSVFS